MLGLKPTGLPNPIITWSGTTSGSQNLLTNPNVPFATVGTYTFTVNRPCTFDLEAVGSGIDGNAGVAANFPAPDGGSGGGAGASGTASYTFVPNVTYEIRVPARNVAQSAFIGIQGGAKIIEMNSGSGRLGGAVVTGSGDNGGDGGLGGIGESVAPGGSNGTVNGAGAGGGGGGGTQGSTTLGGGGNGGGMTNGTSDHGTPPGFGDQGGIGRSVTCAGISAGAGGGGGASGDTDPPLGGNPTPGQGQQGAVEMNYTG